MIKQEYFPEEAATFINTAANRAFEEQQQ